jgi:hypothetical protein
MGVLSLWREGICEASVLTQLRSLGTDRFEVAILFILFEVDATKVIFPVLNISPEGLIFD